MASRHGGAPFNRFHVTSLCSPTRASFFTGRNHHAVGMGFLADIPLAFPGYHARLPKSAATLPRVLRDAGYSTMAVGKWHLTPRWQRSAAGPFDTWPLGLGFERYYGFLQGDTNHWTPNLVCDNHYIEPPGRPEEGYHLTEDLADQAVRMVQDQQQGAPGKPFFLYFALGAMHAPHHVAPEWVDPYRGVFDKGWDIWRDEVFARQRASGIVPAGTVLTERPSGCRAGTSSRPMSGVCSPAQQEVFAGFLTHTDAQIGRVLSSLEQLGAMDNTLVMVFSDNGASAEGGKAGSFNEHRFTAHVRESMAENLAHYDDWGGFSTYNHYSWAWAWAGNTPHKLWKRYTWLGGTRTPLIVHWPGRIAAAGIGALAVRPRHRPHADDPARRGTRIPGRGRRCGPAAGGRREPPVGAARTRRPPSCTTRSTSRCWARGPSTTRGGRRRPTTSAPASSTRRSSPSAAATSTRTAGSSSTSRRTSPKPIDRAGAEPERVRQLRDLWDSEAQLNHVLPISDGLVDRLAGFIPPAWPAGPSRTFRPGGSAVADESVPLLWGGFDITADIDVDGPDGVVFALGDWFGGYALYLVGGRAHFTFARAADALELVTPSAVEAGRHEITVSYAVGQDGADGRMVLRVDGAEVDETAVEWHAPAGGPARRARDCGWPGTAGSPSPRATHRRRASKGRCTASWWTHRARCAPTPRARCAPRSMPTDGAPAPACLRPSRRPQPGRGPGAHACGGPVPPPGRPSERPGPRPVRTGHCSRDPRR